jgi:dipeptidyl aminopeptidase/acylaminoacyl peptidase
LADGALVGDPYRLTRQPGSCANPRFSPDGQWIAYHGVIEGQREIWVLPSAGGTPVNLTAHEAVDVQPVWSPDGTRIAFSSNRSGSYEIWAADIEDGRLTGPVLQITEIDGIVASPCWSPDSLQLAFVLVDGERTELHLVDAEGSGEPRRLTDGADARGVAWDVRSGEILVKGLWGGQFFEVRAVDPVTGAATPRPEIAPLSPSAVMGSFDVSADGRMVVWAEEEDYGDLWMLEGEQFRF